MAGTDGIEALSGVYLSSQQQPKEMWSDTTIVVEALHKRELDRVLGQIANLRATGNRQNIRLIGRPGIGKSHFLGRVRRRVTGTGDFFVACHLARADGFWRTLALAYANALYKRVDGGTQLQKLLAGLFRAIGLPDDLARSLIGKSVDADALRELAGCWAEEFGPTPEGVAAADVAQALVLYNSADFAHQDVANAVIQGLPLDDRVDHRALGIRHPQIEPRRVVKALDMLARVAGEATVVAIDQIDGLIANAERTAPDGGKSELNELTTALMDFAEDAESTLIVLSCIMRSWVLLETEGLSAFAARYPLEVKMSDLMTPEEGRELIAGLLGQAYGRVGCTPPWPTWPIREEAFADAVDHSPRTLIDTVDKHIAACRDAGEITELDRLVEGDHPPPKTPQPPKAVGNDALRAIDARFTALKEETLARADPDAENLEHLFVPLLSGALAAWIGENGDLGTFRQDPILDAKPQVHARLRRILDVETEDEEHWCFRAIPHQHHLAQQSRISAAVNASGLGPRRALTLVRNRDWNPGPKTRTMLREVESAGGTFAGLSREDLATFDALTRLTGEKPRGLTDWLRSRRPASGTALLGAIAVDGVAVGERPTENHTPASPPASDTSANGSAGEQETSPGTREPSTGKPRATSFTDRLRKMMEGSRAGSTDGAAGSPPPTAPSVTEGKAPHSASAEPVITLGTQRSGAPMTLRLEDLRRHACIFAGSGSGKTVLLRRIVEACALEGVSAIVLDPNNDLARLGSPWPVAPDSWLPGDAARAAEYFASVETVVWTPRVAAGRPLAFAPLGGLEAVSDDADEFSQAIDNAVGLIAPRAGLPASGRKLEQGRAVLREALAAFVRDGGSDLSAFLGYLNTLPDGVSRLDDAGKLASEMAQTLIAATVNDPLFGGSGEPVDPGALLSPSPGKRVRVSVISFVGLPNDDQKQGFVSQLEMALFAWVKKNPAGERPLGGLLVMDEAQNFVPSGRAVASSQPTMALASQARKYGLGLLFATQAPKGLHNHIAGNASTQIFGFLNAPAQIEAAEEIAKAKGGTVGGIGKLSRGTFFIATEDRPFTKTDTPMCLSHHPKSPLDPTDVVALASSLKDDA